MASWPPRRLAADGESVLPIYAIAPMVDQSELAFRVLCRRHGANLCYTPMLQSRMFAESQAYRDRHISPADGKSPHDRPLVVQFAANDPDQLLAAAKICESNDLCDAIDLNLGCPQKIAKRGRFGAFLLEEFDLLRRLVGTLHSHCSLPVTCKIRLIGDQTIDLARLLQDAGCSLLTVHGRTKEQKGRHTGACRWEPIADVRAALRIPVLANGGMETLADATRCIAATGCAGVMVAEAALENPAFFEGGRAGDAPIALALEYLDVREAYPSHLTDAKQHLFQMLFAPLQCHPALRDALHAARTMPEMRAVVDALALQPPARRGTYCSEAGDAYTSWYRRHAVELWKLPGAGCKPREGDEDVKADDADAECPWLDGLFDSGG